MLGEYLRQVRKEKKLTLRQIQDDIGISNAHLSQVENGKIKKPTPELLIKLAEIIEMAFREDDTKSDTKEELSENAKILAKRSYDLIYNYKYVPGMQEDGTLDAKHLLKWVTSVRQLCAEKKRLGITDLIIGQHILAHAPVDPNDNIWPHMAVRDILETYKSENMEEGLSLGIYNKRGVITKGCYEGGQQERELADKYDKWASACEGKWAHISKVLRDIKRGYRYESKREDIRAEQDMHMFDG